MPLVPGTFGSAVGLAIWYFVTDFYFYWGLFLLILLFSIPGIKSVVEETGSKDPSPVVVDEILGFMLAAGMFQRDVLAGMSLFILFRIFDIVKPWPASWAEKEEGVPFIILDDLIAGIYAALAHYIFLVKLLIPYWR
jgi:phosphatidylglycerophosphatase A